MQSSPRHHQLPPVRQYDHAIALKPEAVLFNARPYRYSPAHKDEIERHSANISTTPLKKGFTWTEQATKAFLTLKQAMMTTPVLQLPNFQKQFIVETDACDSSIGAVLMQVQHPIAFLSKPLSAAHQHLSIYEKKFLALLMAVESAANS
jgi:hypothetical protein